MYSLKKGVVIPFLGDNKRNGQDESDRVFENDEESSSLKDVISINDEIFVNMSHELRTPLNVLFGAAQLMELSLTSDENEYDKEKLMGNVVTIKKNCYRLTRLVNNMTDMSRIKSGNMKLNLENEDVVHVLRKIVQLSSQFISEQKLSIEFTSDTEDMVIAFDVEKIERVILNLISNSIKFSNEGGKIVLKVVNKGSKVEISVIDEGIGIEEQYLENIFDRFGQVDKSLSRTTEGSGIGLSIVKSIVEMHNGNITVESEVGAGSIFKIELPAIKTYKLYNEYRLIHHHNIDEMIKIEFSDIA